MNEANEAAEPRDRSGFALVAACSLAYFSVWWNQAVAPVAGGELIVMQPLGLLPYKDFFYQAPPGAILLIRMIETLAGPRLIALLAFGVVLKTLGVCATYGLTRRIARPSFAAAAALFAMFVSGGDISDDPFYYNNLGGSLMLVGAWAGASSIEARGGSRWALAAASGAALVFATLIKQTLVFGAAAAILAMFIWAGPALRSVIGPCLGGGVIGGGLVGLASGAWLVRYGLVDGFLSCMRDAGDGKGGLGRSLLRPIALLADPFLHIELRATLVAFAILIGFTLLWLRHGRGAELTLPARFALPVGVTAAFLVGFGAIHATSRDLTLLITALGWWGSLLLAALALVNRDPEDPSQRWRVGLGLLGFGMGYSFAVSWPLFEYVAYPGLAFVLAAWLERPPTVRRDLWVGALVSGVAMAAVVIGHRKEATPRGWGLWTEPPLTSASASFSHPGLAGMRISEPAGTLYSGVAEVAMKHTTASDAIYVYPNLPILYAIAGRRPATYAVAHWVDICPDFLGELDAKALRDAPPAMLVIEDVPPGFIEASEWLYRGGRPSSVRNVVDALDAILPGYELVKVIQPGASSAPVRVYVRRDR